jgi:hypothetical protein
MVLVKTRTALVVAALAAVTLVLVFATVAYAGATEFNIIYKNYDGSDITNLNPELPTSYVEGVGVTIPLVPPFEMPGYIFFGYWDVPLDPSERISVTTPVGEIFMINHLIGTPVTAIPPTASGDVTIYVRFISQSLVQSLNDGEAFIGAPNGVFPDFAIGEIQLLDSSVFGYEELVARLDLQATDLVRIARFSVVDNQYSAIAPNLFFGDVLVGFMLPAGFDPATTQLIYLPIDGEPIVIPSRIWTNPEDGALFIDGWTQHLGVFAIVSRVDEPAPEPTPDPGLPSTGEVTAFLPLLATASIGSVLIGATLSRRRQR